MKTLFFHYVDMCTNDTKAISSETAGTWAQNQSNGTKLDE